MMAFSKCLALAALGAYIGATAAQNNSATNCTVASNVMTCQTSTTFDMSALGVAVPTPSAGNGTSITFGAAAPVTGCSLNAPTNAALNTANQFATLACTVNGAAVTPTSPNIVQTNNTTGSVSSAPTTSLLLNTTTAGTYTISATATVNSAPVTISSRSFTVSTTTAAAPVCSLSTSATSVAAGASITLSAICNNVVPATTTYVWKKDGAVFGSNQSTQTNIAFAAGTNANSASYSVVATEGSQSSPSTSISVTKAVTYGTSCPANTSNYVMNPLYTNNIDSSGQYLENPVLITLDIGSSAAITTAGKSRVPSLWFVETSGGLQAAKEVTISTSPCNFTNPEFVVAGPNDYASTGRVSLFINDPSRNTFYPKLTTGRWFINVRNVPGTCSGTCNTNIQYTDYVQ